MGSGSLDGAIVVAAVEWGAISDWVSGIATAIAVVVALVFSLRAERDQRNAHLAAVHAWFEGDAPSDEGSVSGSLIVVNSTDYPIYVWRAVVGWSGPTGESSQLTATSAALGLLPPGRHDYPLTTSEGGASGELPANDAQVKVTMTFTDASGRVLQRAPGGKLRKLKTWD